jgi:hypothetical protein
MCIFIIKNYCNIIFKIIMKRLTTLILAFLIGLGMQTAYAYTGGSGTAGDPYQISSPADIDELMHSTNKVSDWASYFILTQNINCGSETWDHNGSTQADPIGNSSIKFTGNFNGHGYTISNISYNLSSTDYIGFFGYLDVDGVVSNLNLIGIDANGKNYVGCLCGYNRYGTISQCSTNGDADGQNYIGGFCGNSGGFIRQCTANANASGYGNYLAGFCGTIEGGTVSECSAIGNLTGTSNSVGGFCGYMEGGTVSKCTTIGSVSGDMNIGGFCGYNSYGIIERAYSYGSVSGNSNLGGFVGNNDNGNYTCCFWNSTANPSPINDSGNEGDLGDDVILLTAAQFTEQSNFPCFDFENEWMMYESLPMPNGIYNTFIIPTLSEWAVISFIGLLAGVGGWFVWRRS